MSANKRPPIHPRQAREAAGHKVNEKLLKRVARIREFVRSLSDFSLP